MSDTRVHSGANATPRTPAASSATNKSAPSHARSLYVRAAARSGATREVTRLACAATLALALGVGCGLWVFARLASASPTLLKGARSLPAARAAEGSAQAPTAVPEAAGGDVDAAPSSPVEAAPSPGAPSAPQARVLGASRDVALAEGREAKRAAFRVKGAESAGEASPKAATRQTKAVRGAGGANPCSTYASAGSLSLRGGATAALVLGGPGPITVTTPNWADIAVFNEGGGGAGRAWTKYAVRSVSGKAGSYTLRLTSPCGAQTIPVRVTPR